MCPVFSPKNSTLVDGNILVVQIEGNFRKNSLGKQKKIAL